MKRMLIVRQPYRGTFSKYIIYEYQGELLWTSERESLRGEGSLA